MSRYEVLFKPKCLEAEDSAYQGTVTLRLPDWDKRSEILEATGGLEGSIKEKLEATGGLHRMTKVLAQFSPGLVVSVDIRRKDDGTHLTTWEDVRHEGPLARDLVPEVAWWPLMGKHLVSDPSKPS